MLWRAGLALVSAVVAWLTTQAPVQPHSPPPAGPSPQAAAVRPRQVATAKTRSPPTAARAPDFPQPDGSMVTLRGEKVRSRAEQRIANKLYRLGYQYEYERRMYGLLPDFYLPELDLVVEYWGLNSDDYLKNKRKKLAIYYRHHQKVVSLNPDRWADIERALVQSLWHYDKTINSRAKRVGAAAG